MYATWHFKNADCRNDMSSLSENRPSRPRRSSQRGAAPMIGWSLGLRTATPADLIVRVERGFSIAALDRFRDRMALSMDELAEVVGTSSRTLARRKQAGRLDAAESDRLYRLARLFERAVDVFGGDKQGEDDARRWFHLPQWALDDATPLNYARTEPGAREVEALLDRMDYGVLA